MQKNKLVHEDIKAVCNSAAKKLVAMGLATATTVGGANFAGLSYKNIACAQTGENQQLYDATLSYNYVDFILMFIKHYPALLTNAKGRELFLNELDRLQDEGTPENIINQIRSCFQQACRTGRFDINFFAALVARDRWVYEHRNGNTPEGGDSVELLLRYASFNENYMESRVEEANRYNLAPLADEMNKGYTRIADGYRALAERVRANGGCVDDAIINELIELRMTEQDTRYQFDKALGIARIEQVLTNEQLRNDPNWLLRLEAALQRAYNLDLALLGLNELDAEYNRNQTRQRLMANPTEIDAFEARIEKLETAERARLERILEELRAEQPDQQMIQARENQQIDVGQSTSVQSSSEDELIQKISSTATITGPDALEIDNEAVTASDRNENSSRNVTVNSLTASPGTSTRLQNGTEFTMGATREETIDNLIPDIQPSAYQERNTQQRNLSFNNPRLQRMLAWAMERFGLTGQDLIDFVQHFFIQGG